MRIFASPILRMVLLAAAAWLAGCASNPPAQVVDLSLPNENATTATNASGSESAMYRVVRGDTLYSIAFKHGLDYRDLATWNGIASPYRILVGQELRLSAPPAPVVAAASRFLYLAADFKQDEAASLAAAFNRQATKKR